MKLLLLFFFFFRTNFSSSSSVNLSDSDKDPCLTSNEADDEQSDWPRDESSVPRVISWWEDNDDDDEDEKSENDDEKMLTTTDGTLQKIVNGALSMMLANSKNTIQNRIKTFVHREMLTGNRRNIGSKVSSISNSINRTYYSYLYDVSFFHLIPFVLVRTQFRDVNILFDNI